MNLYADEKLKVLQNSVIDINIDGLKRDLTGIIEHYSFMLSKMFGVAQEEIKEKFTNFLNIDNSINNVLYELYLSLSIQNDLKQESTLLQKEIFNPNNIQIDTTVPLILSNKDVLDVKDFAEKVKDMFNNEKFEPVDDIDSPSDLFRNKLSEAQQAFNEMQKATDALSYIQKENVFDRLVKELYTIAAKNSEAKEFLYELLNKQPDESIENIAAKVKPKM